MTLDETALVLAKAAAIDQRTVGRADVMAWHEILERVHLDHALEAVRRHYAGSTQRIMPADVVRLDRVVRDEQQRTQHSDALALPSRFENPACLDVSMRPGIASCRQVVAAIGAKLAAQRQPDTELSESEQRRQRALARARAERHANRQRGVA